MFKGERQWREKQNASNRRRAKAQAKRAVIRLRTRNFSQVGAATQGAGRKAQKISAPCYRRPRTTRSVPPSAGKLGRSRKSKQRRCSSRQRPPAVITPL